jgi:hypothetical protein
MKILVISDLQVQEWGLDTTAWLNKTVTSYDPERCYYWLPADTVEALEIMLKWPVSVREFDPD